MMAKWASYHVGQKSDLFQEILLSKLKKYYFNVYEFLEE